MKKDDGLITIIFRFVFGIIAGAVFVLPLIWTAAMLGIEIPLGATGLFLLLIGKLSAERGDKFLVSFMKVFKVLKYFSFDPL